MSGLVGLPAMPWGRIGLGVGLLAGALLYGLWQGAERRADKWQHQAERFQRELGRISMERNEQAKTSERTVERVKVVTRDADKVAKRIEAAPLPGECKTPPQILGADL